MARDWSEDDDDLLRRYAASGLSMRQAARALSVTRNAVIGRADRKGIQFQAEHTRGGGCTPDAALRGWNTRRERASA